MLVAANSFMNPFIYAAKVIPYTLCVMDLLFQVKAFRNILRGYVTKWKITEETESEFITENTI